MAIGRDQRETGYCEYQFLDGSFCPYKIEIIDCIENDKQAKKNRWVDSKNHNFCIIHSDNKEKASELYSILLKKINETNIFIRNYQEGYKLSKLSDQEKKKKIDEVRFNKLLILEGCYFPEDIIFQKLIFESDVTFQKCIFNGNVSFYMSEFGGKVNFREVEFHGDSKFSNAKFHNDALFENSKFYGEADFLSANFNGVSAFSSTHFGINIEPDRNIVFTEAKFKKESFFNYVHFHQNLLFLSGEFDEKVTFKKAIFRRKADFNGVLFQKNADFDLTEFINEVTFIILKCEGEISFRESLFRKNTNFTSSSIVDKLDFSDAIFLKGTLIFTKAKFPTKETLFHNTVFNCEVLFHEQMLKGVRFTGCYLGSASFYGSDVRDAVFINSSWNKRFLEKQVERLKKDKIIEDSTEVLDVTKNPPRTKRRAILFDEKSYKASKKKNKNDGKNRGEASNPELDPLYLEHLYCQFKLAMDRNKMYGLANDFYYGEKLMETKRLREEHSYLKWAFLWLYRLLAGFGNRPLWAISWLIIILLASSFLLIRLNGLNVENKKDAFERCSFENNVTKSAAIDKPNLKTPTTLTKAGKSNESTLLNHNINNIISSNRQTPSTQPANTSKQDNTKKEAGYSLKDSYWSNIFYVSLWNLTASPGRKSSDYKENGWIASLAVFLIQYIFRPLMVALIIISVRRKVYRG